MSVPQDNQVITKSKHTFMALTMGKSGDAYSRFQQNVLQLQQYQAIPPQSRIEQLEREVQTLQSHLQNECNERQKAREFTNSVWRHSTR